MVSLKFFICIILPAALWPWIDSASNRNEYQEYFLGVKAEVSRADNLTTFMCRLSWNLGASASWNPQGLSRTVMGLLYLFTVLCTAQIEALFIMNLSKFFHCSLYNSVLLITEFSCPPDFFCFLLWRSLADTVRTFTLQIWREIIGQ